MNRQCQDKYLFLRFEVSKVSEELCLRGELGGLQEMKQAKEFLHSVLERSACQQDLVFLGITTPHTQKRRHEERREDVLTVGPSAICVHT